MMESDEAIDDVKASLSLEELLDLRNKLNRKVYSELIFGSNEEDEEKNSKKKKGPKKRANHHRPREESSKKPPDPIMEVFPSKKVSEIVSLVGLILQDYFLRKNSCVRRDPRFEENAGLFDEKIFKSRYSFISEIKEKERRELEKEFKKEKDPERCAQIKLLMQKYDNQKRAEQAKVEREKVIKKLKDEKREELGITGKKRIFVNKCKSL